MEEREEGGRDGRPGRVELSASAPAWDSLPLSHRKLRVPEASAHWPHRSALCTPCLPLPQWFGLPEELKQCRVLAQLAQRKDDPSFPNELRDALVQSEQAAGWAGGAEAGTAAEVGFEGRAPALHLPVFLLLCSLCSSPHALCPCSLLPCWPASHCQAQAT